MLSAMEISQRSPKVTNISNMIGNLMTIENYKVPPGIKLSHFEKFYYDIVKEHNTFNCDYTCLLEKNNLT